MSVVSVDDYQQYLLGDIVLQSGETLYNAKLAFKTFGTLNADKSNVIVYPTWFTGFFSDNEWLIGEGMALDPAKYFIIVLSAFGNGQSSSPSNTPAPQDKGRFPHITLYDNVTNQHRLVAEHFGITRIKLVVGWSMGAQQTYQWAALYPEEVERIAPFCGSARTAPHNFVFLEGVKHALITDAAYNNGDYTAETRPEKGLRAVGRVYAGWGLTQAYYKHETWRTLGFNSLEEFLVKFWEAFFLLRDPNNLLAMLWTWQNADISANHLFDKDFRKALQAIKARTLMLPAAVDLYFPWEDNKDEADMMSVPVDFTIIPGVWGHFAGGGACAEDTKFIDDKLKELLSLPSGI